MRLTKKDILNIDRYLIKKGIKYMDVRYELIDHLVSEYEVIENYPDLDSFLRKRTAWCRKVAEKKAKSVHWGYQKALLKRFLSLFRSPIFYGILLIWFSSIFFIEQEFGKSVLNKTMFWLFVVAVVFQYIDFSYWRFGSKKESKMLSASTLINIYSLPNFLIYFIGYLETEFERNIALSIAYFSIGILINIVAFIEVRSKREKAFAEYDFIKPYLS